MSDIPLGLVVSFGFFTLVLAITGVSWNLRRQRAEARRQAAALRASLQAPSVQAQADYEQAVEEALRNNPSLADASDPSTVYRLAQEVAAIQERKRLLQAVNVAKMKREADERAEAHRAEQESLRRERLRRNEEREARLRVKPLWRRWWHRNPLLGSVFLLVAAGAIVLLAAGGFQGWVDAQQVAEERQASLALEAEQRQVREDRKTLLREQSNSCDASIPRAEIVDSAATGQAWLTCASAEARAAGLELIGPDGPLAFNEHMQFAQDPDPRVRAALAARSAVYGAAEEILAADTDPAVREALARNTSSPKALNLLIENLTEPVHAILLSREYELPEQIRERLPPACVTYTADTDTIMSGTVWKERLDTDYVMGYRLNRDCSVDVKRWYRASSGVTLDSEQWNQRGTTVTIGGTQWVLAGKRMTNGPRVLSLVTDVKTSWGRWSIR